jgi:imidazole glycerol-phosphate synthase subunit HisF
MLKKRLIFTLLIAKGLFQLSRNFSLQSVGTFDWLRKHYHFLSISRSVDELVLLNVTRGDKQMGAFCDSIAQLSASSFMPIAAGGGIASLDDAYRLLNAGADKLVVNSALFTTPRLVEDLARTFGRQCVVASLDYRGPGLDAQVYSQGGKQPAGMGLGAAIRHAESLGAGELYVTSIDRDGTGQGYDLDTLEPASELCRLPIVASGGVGNFEHLLQGLQLKNVTGASTANIFNFMSDGLTQARRFIEANQLPLAHWEFPSSAVGSPATSGA